MSSKQEEDGMEMRKIEKNGETKSASPEVELKVSKDDDDYNEWYRVVKDADKVDDVVRVATTVGNFS